MMETRKAPQKTNISFFHLGVLLFILVAFDQIGKNYFQHFKFNYFSWLQLRYYENKGLIFGSFLQMNDYMGSVVISTLSGLCLLVCFFLIYLNKFKNVIFCSGLTLISAGILGNFIDRIFHHHVIDFIFVQWKGQFTVAFNFADTYQWMGFCLILIEIVFCKDIFYVFRFLKYSDFLNKKLYKKLSTLFFLLSCFSGAIVFVFTYTFFNFYRSTQLSAEKSYLLQHQFLFFSVGLFFVISILAIFYFLLCKYVSKQIAGQIYAFERHINTILADPEKMDLKIFKLREGDDFKKSFETLALKIEKKIYSNKV